MRIRRAWLPGLLGAALLAATGGPAAAGASGATGGGLVVGQGLKLAAGDAGAGDEFGFDVDIDGATAIVGAPLENEQTGAAYVFVRDGDSWVQEAKLVAYDGLAGDRFGWSVALSGDTALVGAYLKDDGGIDGGAAYAFRRTGTTWASAVKLPRTAHRAQGQENFGVAVEIEGDRALVAAYLDDLDPGDAEVLPVGSVTVYERAPAIGPGDVWTEGALLVASDGAANDRFGRSIALSGDTALIGAYQDDDGGNASGSAYVFVRGPSGWSEQQKLVPQDHEAGDWFGYAVSLLGDRALIGAPLADLAGDASGAAITFTRSGTSWSEEGLLVHEDIAAGDEYGFATDLAGELAIVGARHDVNELLTLGAAYVFRQSATRSVAFDDPVVLRAGDAEVDDEFGYAVATDGLGVVVGARFEDEGGDGAGAVYSYVVTPPPYRSYCPDEGLECPCQNQGLPGRGCDNSAGTGGVQLSATQFLPDGEGGGSVLLVGTGFQPGSPTALAIRSRIPDTIGKPFGDGLLCLVFPIRRLRGGLASGGNVRIPLTHNAGADTFYYQLWYRNQPDFCDALLFNVSNGIAIDWP